MVGDSNFRCINDGGVMASVTSITGGKIGHIVNQLKYIDTTNSHNIVLSAGQNNVAEVDDFSKEDWSQKLDREIDRYEKVIQTLKNKGKNVFIIGVPPTQVTQASKRAKEARNEVNKKLSDVAQRLMKEKKTGNSVVAFMAEEEGNYNKQTDFTDDRHISPKATTRLLNTIDNVLPQGQKLITTELKGKLTSKPYRGCYGTHPIGCRTCTAIGHSEGACNLNTKKRIRSTGDDECEAQKKTLSINF